MLSFLAFTLSLIALYRTERLRRMTNQLGTELDADEAQQAALEAAVNAEFGIFQSSLDGLEAEIAILRQSPNPEMTAAVSRLSALRDRQKAFIATLPRPVTHPSAGTTPPPTPETPPTTQTPPTTEETPPAPAAETITLPPTTETTEATQEEEPVPPGGTMEEQTPAP